MGTKYGRVTRDCDLDNGNYCQHYCEKIGKQI